MQIIEPSVELLFFAPENGMSMEEVIEIAGRNCYKSENKMTEDSAADFIRMLRSNGHHAMLEFGWAMAKISADRGLSHELVRHRLMSIAQESTRYCNYLKDRFGSEIVVVQQPGLDEEQQSFWEYTMEQIEKSYFCLIEMGVKPQIARSVLPIGLRADIWVGANLREWRHVFNMRCSKKAHPIIRGVMREALGQFAKKMPTLYEDQVERFLIEGPGFPVRDTNVLFEDYRGHADDDGILVHTADYGREWVPQMQIMEDSPVQTINDNGMLKVTRVFAKEKGWLEAA